MIGYLATKKVFSPCPRIVEAKSNQATKGAKSDIRQAGTSLEASGEVGHEIFSSLKIGICIVPTFKCAKFLSSIVARLRIFPTLIPAMEMRRSCPETRSSSQTPFRNNFPTNPRTVDNVQTLFEVRLAGSNNILSGIGVALA